jgi:FMN phosphatase YigB (HAD superfamily)
VPAAEFYVIGRATEDDSAYEAECRALASRLGLDGDFHWTGYLEEPLGLMASLDVCVHAAVEPEPFGRVIIEALALGVPVVATAVGGPVEIIEDGVSGFLVPPADPGSIAQRTIGILTDRGLADRIRQGGSDRVQRAFSMDAYIREIERVYEEALSGAAPATSSERRVPSAARRRRCRERGPRSSGLFDAGGTILRVNPSVGRLRRDRGGARSRGAAGRHLQAFRAAWRRASSGAGREGTGRRTRSFARSGSRLSAIPSARARRRRGSGRSSRTSTSGSSPRGRGRSRPGRARRSHSPRSGGSTGGFSRTGTPQGAELEIDRAFEFIVVSHEVGYEKPHARIFEEALQRAGTDPGETLHVGDSYEADILPAAAMGLRTLWVAPRAEREAVAGAGPGVDALPAEPLPFWEAVIEGWAVG